MLDPGAVGESDSPAHALGGGVQNGAGPSISFSLCSARRRRRAPLPSTRATSRCAATAA